MKLEEFKAKIEKAAAEFAKDWETFRAEEVAKGNYDVPLEMEPYEWGSAFADFMNSRPDLQ